MLSLNLSIVNLSTIFYLKNYTVLARPSSPGSPGDQLVIRFAFWNQSSSFELASPLMRLENCAAVMLVVLS